MAAIGSCHPQRLEFRRSARNADEYEQISAMFDDLDDNDFAAAAQRLTDLDERRVRAELS